ncbi:uncharacterized protein LOC107775824 [Nicotiana tabacum]|uniref:Protein Jade-1-like n=1 Tax=Nicotiana tabacum TaxID=4097 RepID=A0A1S3YFV9_TOBAC|nr:protein Jade-1 [Nicotiana tomentosiformis]XP_016451094.1 PREDICTED: protein Jade-1-like [Nicotiana tabacum]
MGGKLQFLPPAKRFMLMQQQEQHIDNASVSFSQLPAKKRKFSPEKTTSFSDSTNVTTLCLPAKKRVWAFHPFDLNVEYNPISSFDDEAKEEKLPKETLISQADITLQQDDNGDDDNEDGIICAICESTDGDPTDPIVLCDGCDLMVHTTCYGHPFTKGIPEGDWFCAQCLASKTESPKPITCYLCPETSGALKPTVNEGKWAHVVCALFVPEVFFVDPEGREGIDFSKVPKRRWEQKCYICKSRNGCAIDCSEPKCPLSFHVTCGLKNELCIEYTEGKNKGAVVAGFCRSHTELWKKQQQTGKFKIVPRDEVDR